jgi:hypothetical protein
MVNVFLILYVIFMVCNKANISFAAIQLVK